MKHVGETKQTTEDMPNVCTTVKVHPAKIQVFNKESIQKLICMGENAKK